MDFIRVKGERFYQGEKEICFSGLGVGTWLNLEHFMLGIPTPERMIREAFTEVFGPENSGRFFDDFARDFLDEKDFALLRDMGINLIRVPFNYGLFLDDREPDGFREEGFACFDRLFHLCRKYGIYVLPDLHAAPGGQNPDWHSDNLTGIPQFWHYKVFQDQVVGLWREIARRYAGEPCILGYDLLNEPYLMPAEKGVIQDFYERVTRAVREVDQNHILFLEGDFFAMDFSAIEKIEDEQTALTFHFYPTVWEPDLCDIGYGREKRRAVFEKRFKKLLDQAARFGRPLLCGEAGYDIAGNDMGHVMEMVEDTLDLFVKYRVSWTLWCYKDACFMGLTYPQGDSPWMRFAGEIREHWTHYREMETGKRIIGDISREFPESVSGELQYRLQFRLRSILFCFQKEQILKPQLKRWGWDRVREMPESFRFENCGCHDGYRQVLERYSKKMREPGG